MKEMIKSLKCRNSDFSYKKSWDYWVRNLPVTLLKWVLIFVVKPNPFYSQALNT